MTAVEPGIGCAAEQFAVLDARPLHVRRCDDFMAGQFQPNLVGKVLVEQQLHAGAPQQVYPRRIDYVLFMPFQLLSLSAISSTRF